MELEEKKVLLNRLNVVQSLQEKEWWFSYLYDERTHVYFSWSFSRSFVSDHFRFWLHDLQTERTWRYSKNLFLEPSQHEGVLDLQYHKGMDISYEAIDSGHARLRLANARFHFDLTLARSPYPFIKRDNYFRYHYTLLHHFRNHVQGHLELDGQRYDVDTFTSYADHCFGKVPSRTKWHWLAVQNQDVFFASLANYGAYAQKYTHVFHGGQWHRLSEDVSFEYDHRHPTREWRLTSPDLDLEIHPLQIHPSRVSVPPLLPLAINLKHNELIVKVRGKIRIDGAFVDVDELVGVMEEHHGRW